MLLILPVFSLCSPFDKHILSFFFQSKLKGHNSFSFSFFFLSIAIVLNLYMYMVVFTREWRALDTNLWSLTPTNSQPIRNSSLFIVLKEAGPLELAAKRTGLGWEERPWNPGSAMSCHLGKVITVSGPWFPHDRYHYCSYFSTWALHIIKCVIICECVCNKLDNILDTRM